MFWRVVAEGAKKAHLTIRAANAGTADVTLCDKPLGKILHAETFVNPDGKLCKPCLIAAGFVYSQRHRPAKSPEDARVKLHKHLLAMIPDGWAEEEKVEARRQITDHLNKVAPRTISN